MPGISTANSIYLIFVKQLQPIFSVGCSDMYGAIAIWTASELMAYIYDEIQYLYADVITYLF